MISNKMQTKHIFKNLKRSAFIYFIPIYCLNRTRSWSSYRQSRKQQIRAMAIKRSASAEFYFADAGVLDLRLKKPEREPSREL